MDKSFGEWIASKRKRAGVTQEKIASAVGFKGIQFISNVERNISLIPVDRVYHWAKACKMSPNILASRLIKEQAKQYGEKLESHLAEFANTKEDENADSEMPEVSESECRGEEMPGLWP